MNVYVCVEYRMRTVVIDDRGRILIPKDVRKQIGLRPGQQVRIELQKNAMILTLINSLNLLKKLKGCIETSDIDPLELKHMWN